MQLTSNDCPDSNLVCSLVTCRVIFVLRGKLRYKGKRLDQDTKIWWKHHGLVVKV